MSYELYVYTPEISIEKLTFSVEMLNRGWRIVYLPEDAFLKSAGTNFLSDHGKLDGSQLIAAWGTDENRANALEDIVAAQNMAELRNIVLNGIGLAVFALSVDPYSFEEDQDEEDAQAILEAMSEEQRKALLAARFQYTFRTSAGRSPLSMDLQDASWKAIAKLSAGLAEDPQSGETSLGEPVPKRNFLQHWFHKLTTPGI